MELQKRLVLWTVCMNKPSRLAVVLITVAVMFTEIAATSPHHSFAAFDLNLRSTVSGTVKAVEWTNPHVWLWIVNDAGVTFGFETNAPSELTRFYQWTRNALKPGDRVSVKYRPLRSGKDGGMLVTVTFPDGRVLRTAATR